MKLLGILSAWLCAFAHGQDLFEAKQEVNPRGEHAFVADGPHYHKAVEDMREKGGLKISSGDFMHLGDAKGGFSDQASGKEAASTGSLRKERRLASTNLILSLLGAENFEWLVNHYRQEPKPKEYTSVGTMSPVAKKLTVDTLNALRASVSYPCTAVDMSTITWSDDLAAHAQEYSETCQFKHDTARNLKNGWGENIGMITKRLTDEEAALFFVENWYMEYKDADWSTGVPKSKIYASSTACKSPNPDGTCMLGHWTQVTWASTQHVGCGYTWCPYAAFTGEPTFTFVCKFSPPGNLVGAPPWHPGAIAGACVKQNPDKLQLCAPNTTAVRCVDKKSTIDWDSSAKGKVSGCQGIKDDGKMDEWCETQESKYPFPGVCAKSCNMCLAPKEAGDEFCGKMTTTDGVGPEVAARWAEYEEYKGPDNQSLAHKLREWLQTTALPFIKDHPEVVYCAAGIVGLFVCWCCYIHCCSSKSGKQ